MAQTAAPGLAWDYYTAPDFLHQKASTWDGTWFLDHPDEDGLVRIGFQPCLPEGVTRDQLYSALRRCPKSSRAYWRAASLLGHHTACMGYFSSCGDAQRLLARILTIEPDVRVRATLRCAGFAPGEAPSAGDRTSEYRKWVEGGCFVLRLSPTSALLSFHPEGSKGWMNLMRLFLERTLPGSAARARYFWPPAMMQNFQGFAAVLAAELTADFIAAGRITQKGRERTKLREKEHTKAVLISQAQPA
ncbi:hypothetical protein [Microvirga massiliensis]|uniref:hypothetical protein n=1 Tax=Microvirga massiliensis TaxID=1033741 RepID=UPI00062B8ED4|nr:hypothetical protein [Microvirga massiliensis]